MWGHKEKVVTHLRKLMLEEGQRHNYLQTTVTSYIKFVADFAKFSAGAGSIGARRDPHLSTAFTQAA